jgi:GT2 family glycosyltransferase
MQIAVLLTCHNRRAKTISCLDALSAQCLPRHTELTIYLVDDGCTDGTAKAVVQRFPEVRIIPGDGNLYWSGGMRLAWCSAIEAADYDAYLWLNDDVKLFPEAVAGLVTSWQNAAAAGRPGIIVGSMCDPDSGRPAYGGYSRDKIIEPSYEMQTCDRINGNVLLVPREVFTVVGNLSPDFSHLYGDIDYGFRARKAGFELWVAPRFLGQCRRNPCPPWADPSVPFSRRWRNLHSPTVYPLRENYVFSTRHYKWRGLIKILKLYLRVLFPGPWNELRHLSGRNEDFSETK